MTDDDFRKIIMDDRDLGTFNISLSPLESMDFPEAIEAAEKIKDYVRQRKEFLIIGDKDVDGLTSTSILCMMLRSLGATFTYYVPTRQEGYGASQDIINRFTFDVLITVDTGIGAHDLLSAVQSSGKPVIIIDHHQYVDAPNVECVVHPKQIGETWCAAYTALWVAKYATTVPFYWIALAAIATMADQMPLRGSNRHLVKYALSHIASIEDKPIRMLFTGKDIRSINDWSYYIIPMLNAAGRMGDANFVVKFLTTSNDAECMYYYNALQLKNEDRKSMTKTMKDKIESIIETNNLDHFPTIIVPVPNGTEGVSGIVAAQLSSKYNKPVIIVVKSNGKWVGSGRFQTGNLYESLRHFSDKMTSFGGHTHAVGFTIDEENLSSIIKDIACYPIEHVIHLSSKIEIELQDWNRYKLDLVSSLEPFGTANPRPVFISSYGEFTDYKLKGGIYHKLVFRASPRIEFLYWNHDISFIKPRSKFTYTINSVADKTTATIGGDYTGNS